MGILSLSRKRQPMRNRLLFEDLYMLTMKNQKMVAETMTQICRRSGKKLPPNMKMTGIRQRLGMVS